jgi:hypothetical protein
MSCPASCLGIWRKWEWCWVWANLQRTTQLWLQKSLYDSHLVMIISTPAQWASIITIVNHNCCSLRAARLGSPVTIWLRLEVSLETRLTGSVKVCGTDCVIWLWGLRRRINCGGGHFSRWRMICGVRIRSLWKFWICSLSGQDKLRYEYR